MNYNQSPNFIYKIVCKLFKKSTVSEQECESDLDDRSYEDALLDVQLTSFFRSEYAKEEPRSGIFPRLIQAIRQHNEKQQKLANASTTLRIKWTLGEKLALTYKFFARADTGRVLSGGLVTMLLIMAVGPNLLHSLPGDNLGKIYMNSFGDLSSDNNYQVNQYPTSQAQPGSSGPTALETTQPLPSSTNTGRAMTSDGDYINPGRIYVDPSFRLSAKTGESIEDLNNKGQHSPTQPGQPNTSSDQQSQSSPDLPYDRPLLGQD